MIGTAREQTAATDTPQQQRHDGRSVVGLIREISSETLTLAQQEVELAKAELSEKARIQASNSMQLLGSGAVLYAGFLCLLTAAVVGLAAWWALYMQWFHALWLSALVIGVIVLIIGGIMMAKAVRTMKQTGVKPEKTLQTLQEDKQWVKEKVT